MTNRTHWVFTLNNPTETPAAFIERVNETGRVRYLVFQLEEGETGTPHWQGYIELTRSNHLSWVRNHISLTAHWEPRQGSRDQARAYSMKEDTRVEGPWEHGEWRDQAQGRRNDLIAYKDAIIGGASKRQLIEDFTLQAAKYPKFYKTVKMAYKPIRTPDSYKGVVLLYGYPGTGKTRFVKDNYPLAWSSPIGSNGSWYDGYDGQTIALFDDFAGKMSKMSLTTTLRVLDIYVELAPTKGSFTWWHPDVVFLTSNVHPSNWYDWQVHSARWPALKRRIKHIYYYPREGLKLYIEEDQRESFFDSPWLYPESGVFPEIDPQFRGYRIDNPQVVLH